MSECGMTLLFVELFLADAGSRGLGRGTVFLFLYEGMILEPQIKRRNFHIDTRKEKLIGKFLKPRKKR